MNDDPRVEREEPQAPTPLPPGEVDVDIPLSLPGEPLLPLPKVPPPDKETEERDMPL